MTVIRRAMLHDLPGTYRVCLLTGDAGADASGLYANPDLVGHVFVGPYVVGEPDLALVAADGDGIAGYCLAALDSRRFAAWAAAEWWPPLRAQYPRRDDGTRDAEIVGLLWSPPAESVEIVEAYPSHLHIDLLERTRGTGTGRAMIERQLRQLADAGSRGCHLTVAATNANAIAFYRHLGWEVVRRDADDLAMAVRLG